MGDVVFLTTRAVSHDTVSALLELLRQARSGEVQGIAYVAMRNAQEYTVDATGSMKAMPTLARGMVMSLDGELARLVDRH